MAQGECEKGKKSVAAESEIERVKNSLVRVRKRGSENNKVNLRRLLAATLSS